MCYIRKIHNEIKLQKVSYIINNNDMNLMLPREQMIHIRLLNTKIQPWISCQ